MRKNTEPKMRDEIEGKAGRIPGGLSDPADIGLLVCYLLGHIGRPLTREQLDEIILGSGLVNYFDFTQSLNDLFFRGQLVTAQNIFTVNAETAHAADVLSDSLPASVRDKILSRGFRVLRRADSMAENNIEVENDDNGGVNLICNMQDKTGPLMSVNASVGNSALAASLGKRFLDNPDLLYLAVFAVLSGDKRGLQEVVDKMNKTP